MRYLAEAENTARSEVEPVGEQGVQPTLQPMIHVEDMSKSVEFYHTLGATIVQGSRDGDWTLLRFGETEVSLLRIQRIRSRTRGKWS
ncbi:VOC family protein [Tengunoibacter tsumagoiensis]|uniref:Glyoxalase/fosfomycin resistance/dioxygenase domain-containing protein n=1 Tax=Tengunoibacter tsumagoiensis TaxID=2014871 RepID=A0A401ZZ96_9CHLR|nr:VOC family protein [Tengunoibacter tsumagoiensis]GCE12179.1 hypothetical protein KTT_20380 [Tengunoibacter tsumagoiensis]